MATATPTQEYLGTGRRKSSIARVRVKPGSGSVSVNDRPLEEFFNNIGQRNAAVAPLNDTNMADQLDVRVRVQGGGITGQAHACRLGIARALKKLNIELEDALRDGGHLTRDGRMKERKKYGLRGARRGTQFSKR
jgi:small subunit ribosomal protein S9